MTGRGNTWISYGGEQAQKTGAVGRSLFGILRQSEDGFLDVFGEVRPGMDDLFQVIGKRGRTANIMFRKTTSCVRKVFFPVRVPTGDF